MRIAIASRTFDPEGHVVLDVAPDTAIGAERSRRISRVATLDGGAAFTDYGASDADMTIKLEWSGGNLALDRAVERLVRLYRFLVVALPHGVFEAAPATFTPSVDTCRLQLLVARRLSE